MQADETPDEAGGFRDQAALTPLHRDQIKVLRVRFGIAALVPLIASLPLDIGPLRELGVPAGVGPGIVALLGIVAVAILPRRRWRAWGWREEEDELFVRHGLFKRVMTVVPFGRVQHIDIAQGPVERRYGLATLILHTAGTRTAQVPLPGLTQAQAEELRERIRAKIRQDLV